MKRRFAQIFLVAAQQIIKKRKPRLAHSRRNTLIARSWRSSDYDFGCEMSWSFWAFDKNRRSDNVRRQSNGHFFIAQRRSIAVQCRPRAVMQLPTRCCHHTPVKVHRSTEKGFRLRITEEVIGGPMTRSFLRCEQLAKGPLRDESERQAKPMVGFEESRFQLLQ